MRRKLYHPVAAGWAAALDGLLLILAVAGLSLADAPSLKPQAHLPLVFVMSTPTPSPTPEPTPIPPDDLAKELQILARINDERAQGGQPPLALVDALTQSSRRHSRDMADNNFTSHTGSDGSNAGQRMLEAGYHWSAWGEIIAWGFNGDPDWVVDWWMNSDPHRYLILSSTFVDFGAGYAYNPASTYKHYWTVNFGRPVSSSAMGAATGHLCAYRLEGGQGGSSLMLYGPEPCPEEP
jgi:uncharacterized protein YkwD